MRRSITGAIALLAIAAPSASADTVASLPSRASVLFALEARSGSFTRVPGRPQQYTLALRGVAPGTTWFTDRPQREAGRVTTRSLLGSWRRLGFAAEPPNAAVVLDAGRNARDTVALELRLRSRDSRRRTARSGPECCRDWALVWRTSTGTSTGDCPSTSSGPLCSSTASRPLRASSGSPASSGFPTRRRRLAHPGGRSALADRRVPGAVQALRDAVRRRRPADVPRADPATPAARHVLAAVLGRRQPELQPDAELPTGELALWALGDTPVSAVGDNHWLPADGRTVAAEDSPTFAERYLFDPPSTFALPNVAAPPGFVYLACVDGDDDTRTFVDAPYLAQVDLFTLVGYPEYRGPGGVFLPLSQNTSLFQLIGTTFGGNGRPTSSRPTPRPQLRNTATARRSTGSTRRADRRNVD